MKDKDKPKDTVIGAAPPQAQPPQRGIFGRIVQTGRNILQMGAPPVIEDDTTTPSTTGSTVLVVALILGLVAVIYFLTKKK